MKSEGRGSRPACEDCQFYWPFYLRPEFGLCKNQRSRFYDMVVVADRQVCRPFRPLILGETAPGAEELQFLWCETCRATFHVTDVGGHVRHKVFTDVAVPPDIHEDTVAGD